jgi:hypothetical protein
MKRLLILCLLCVILVPVVGCRDQNQAITTSGGAVDNAIYIPSNAQARVGNVAIGAGGMQSIEVQDENGQTRQVLATGLWIADRTSQERETVIAAMGHTWDLYGCHFEVVEIEENKGVWLRVIPIEAPCLDE